MGDGYARTSRDCVGVPGAVAATEPGREGGVLHKTWRPKRSNAPLGELADDVVRGTAGRRCWAAWGWGLLLDTFSIASSTVLVALSRADVAGGSFASEMLAPDRRRDARRLLWWYILTASLRLLRSASIWASWRDSMVDIERSRGDSQQSGGGWCIGFRYWVR